LEKVSGRPSLGKSNHQYSSVENCYWARKISWGYQLEMGFKIFFGIYIEKCEPRVYLKKHLQFMNKRGTPFNRRLRIRG
jgi:hypothetical protein